MKMTQGTGTITNYGSYAKNCTLGQLPYKIPVNSLTDIQLFVDIGLIKPTTILYELLHTCGPDAGLIETLATTDYVIGQNRDNRWYGVFKNLTGAGTLNCFVIAITLDSTIYFSEEFCTDECADTSIIEGCYGNLDSRISTDCNGIYFGVHSGTDEPLGSIAITYKHRVSLRNVEITLQSIKNNYKQGLTRTFRTEKEKLFKFWAELIPEWYLSEVDAVMYRGEVRINGSRYLLNETLFEKVDECLKQWNPIATFKESCFQSFSCEADPCQAPPESCCDPVVISATVTIVEPESESSGNPPVPPFTDEIVVVQAFVGGTVTVSGTVETVSGITNGSTVVSCNAFAGSRVFITRGMLPLPGINPGGGVSYYTKNLADNFITFSDQLLTDEFIYIETIP